MVKLWQWLRHRPHIGRRSEWTVDTSDGHVVINAAREHGYRQPIWLALVLAITTLASLAGTLNVGVGAVVTRGIDETAARYLDISAEKAAAAYAIARAIDGSLDVLETTDVDLALVKADPFKVLQPDQELADGFADLMGTSLMVLVAERLLLTVSRIIVLDTVLPLGCVIWLLACAVSWLESSDFSLSVRLREFGRNTVKFALMARLFVPVTCLIGNALTNRFFATELAATTGAMQAASGKINQFATSPVRAASGSSGNGAANPAPPPAIAAGPKLPMASDKPSFFGRMEHIMDDAAHAAHDTAQQAVRQGQAALSDVESLLPNGAVIAQIGHALANLPDEIVTAAAIFVLQAIMPPILAWLLLRGLVGGMIGRATKGLLPGAGWTGRSSFADTGPNTLNPPPLEESAPDPAV